MEISYYNQNNLWNRELTKQEKERIEIINKLIPKDVKTILDAGCGSGTLTNFFDSKKYDITGIDISDTALEYFKHKKVKGSISNLPFEDNSFDLVICSDVLEHIPEKEFDQSIKELKRVSKKYILIISPNDEDIEANQIKCWNCKTIFHINWHIRSLNLEKLVDLFREEFSPVFYTYFGDIWASEPKIKYKIKRIFNEGFLHWEYAICPLCGSKQDKKERNHLSFNIDKFVDKNFNKYLRNFHLNKTEIAVLFTKIENKINQFKYISDTSSHLITLSKKENIDFYTASRFYINLGDNVFCRDKTLPYTSYSYILKSEQSLWSDIKEDNDGKFRSLSSNSRALAIFPITDLKNKRLYISLKVLQNNCNLKVNIYDIEKSFINISTLNLNNINTKETVSIDLPIEIYFPSEGIIIEFVAEPLNEKICEVNFYEMCVSDINLLSPSKKNLTTHKSIEILNMNLNLFKVNKSLLSDDIVVFSESDIYIYNNRLKCFKILEERLFFNENNNMKINELENKLESLLNKLDENNNMKINELENKLENLINKLDENNNMKINELENKLESLLNKLNKINSNIQRISNNIERTIFWAKNPHKFLYRKISSKMSNYLKLKNKTSDSEEKLQDDKFHVVVLTPDVQIDRRTMQMCKTIVENYNAKCTIIAALDGKDKIQNENVIIKRVYPQDLLSNIDNLWFPENLNIDLTEFYWLHNQYLDKALNEKADLYIACDLPVLPAAVIAAKTKNIPIVYDAHELYPEQAIFDENKKELFTKVEKTFIKYANVVITVNESIANEMAKRYFINKPHVILNALNPPENFDISKKYNHFRKNLPINENQKILLFQGGFSPYRNLENLVRSAKYISQDIVIVLMGFGDYEKELKKISKSEGLLNRKVFFHPAVPQEILLEYSASADVGIIPYPHVDLNSYYCTPNKLFEFIQAGLPILANKSPELKRFVEGLDIGITYKLETPKDIAEGINLIFSRDLNIFRKNLLKAREEISWKKEDRKLIEIINKYLGVIKTE